MSSKLAAAVVFFCSAAVLVMEIMAGRLLAPYVGISLQTYTAVIGVVLGGIAAGAWFGGWTADRVNPKRILGPLIIFGGAMTMFIVPLIRGLGPSSTKYYFSATLQLAGIGFFLPAFALSMVTPTVVKLQLSDLNQTGSTVGRLSGIGTIGALIGTFVSGFVLVRTTPTQTLIYWIGGLLIAMGLFLWFKLSKEKPGVIGLLILLAASGTGWTVATHNPCQIESAYFCMRVRQDAARPTGRILQMDNLEHSYVDIKDPTYLGIGYVRMIADVVNASWPAGEKITALHVGGGGFTMPRYIDATRPGSKNTVFEIDPAVVKIGKQKLALKTSSLLKVDIGDGRLSTRKQPSNSADLMVGDAFQSLSVPWHLTTKQYLGDAHRVLGPEGVYVMNLIDFAPYKFVRAELETLRTQFKYVALVTQSKTLTEQTPDNFILVASDRMLDESAISKSIASDNEVLVSGAELTKFIGNTPILTDDFAPVDQWLASEIRGAS